jgi:predicted TIM-barrel fold metal-dependent hydrolase
LSPRGAGAEAATRPVDRADQSLTDTDFDTAALQRAGAMCRSGLRRVVVRELPQTDGAVNGSIAMRAVIAPPPSADRSALQDLDDQGVQGLRFTLDAGSDPHAILGWAERIVALGWHVEVELPNGTTASRLTNAEWALLQAPVPTCFSGLAGFLATRDADDADIAFLLELIEIGRFWLKLSGAEVAGAEPATRDALHRLVNAAMSVREDRLVWGSGQPSAAGNPEQHLDTMIGTLRELVPDPTSRSRVLWSNPAALYHF